MNYEIDSYMEASKKLPNREEILQTLDNDYYFFKQDILAGLITYSTDKKNPANLETITAERANAIIAMNKEGKKPLSLLEDGKAKEPQKPKDMLNDNDITRFDSAKKKKKKKKSHREEKPQEGNQ
jgi:hypothetical protein